MGKQTEEDRQDVRKSLNKMTQWPTFRAYHPDIWLDLGAGDDFYLPIPRINLKKLKKIKKIYVKERDNIVCEKNDAIKKLDCRRKIQTPSSCLKLKCKY